MHAQLLQICMNEWLALTVALVYVNNMHLRPLLVRSMETSPTGQQQMEIMLGNLLLFLHFLDVNL